MLPSRQQLGLLLVLAGTVLLAFSVGVTRQYQGDATAAIDRLKASNPKLIEPTDTRIITRRFRLGLALIFFGTALQW